MWSSDHPFITVAHSVNGLTELVAVRSIRVGWKTVLQHKRHVFDHNSCNGLWMSRQYTIRSRWMGWVRRRPITTIDMLQKYFYSSCTPCVNIMIELNVVYPFVSDEGKMFFIWNTCTPIERDGHASSHHSRVNGSHDVELCVYIRTCVTRSECFILRGPIDRHRRGL